MFLKSVFKQQELQLIAAILTKLHHSSKKSVSSKKKFLGCDHTSSVQIPVNNKEFRKAFIGFNLIKSDFDCVDFEQTFAYTDFPSKDLPV